MAYKRKAPPVAAQVAMGILMDGVMRPLIKFNEWRGAAVRLMGRVATGQHARLRKKNPFRGYVPGPQDVFVMTTRRAARTG